VGIIISIVRGMCCIDGEGEISERKREMGEREGWG